MNLTTKEIALILGSSADCKTDVETTGFSMDSRDIKPGQCFLALKGDHSNGEDYLDQAFTNGASCAIVSQDCSYSHPNLLKVDGVISAMGQLAKAWRTQCNFKVIAVTGSAGKTTTRDMIYHILSSQYSCHKPIKNYNNQIGLPYTILTAPSDTQICIVELGTNAPGEIEYLSKIAAPDIAVITNTYPAHLEGLGSLENIIKEKASIATGLKPDGKLIINDSMQALKQYLDSQNTEYEVFSIDNAVKLPIPGRANLENAAATWQAVKYFNITKDQFYDSFEIFKPTSMRTEIRSTGNKTIIIDCYNANPASMQAALEVLKDMAAAQNKRSVFICGDMYELGSQQEHFHTELGQHIADAGVKLLLTVGELTEKTAETAQNLGIDTIKFKNASALSDKLHTLLQDDDIVLIKGSRSVKLEALLDKIIK